MAAQNEGYFSKQQLEQEEVLKDIILLINTALPSVSISEISERIDEFLEVAQASDQARLMLDFARDWAEEESTKV